MREQERRRKEWKMAHCHKRHWCHLWIWPWVKFLKA